MSRCCEALRDWDVRGQLEDVIVSTLVVGGSEDPATPLPKLEAIAAEIPKAQLVVLEGARHLVNVEHAAAFNDALLAHLE